MADQEEKAAHAGEWELSAQTTEAASGQVGTEDYDNEEMSEAPSTTWSSMAAKLRQPGGQLTQAKPKGVAATATPSLSAPRKGGAVGSGVADGAGGPISTAPAVSASPAVAPQTASSETNDVQVRVRMMLSKLPADLEAEEISQSLDQLMVDEGLSGTVEVEQRDPMKEWVHFSAPSREVADALVQLGKDRKVVLQGKALKVEILRSAEKRGGKGQKSDAKGDVKGDDSTQPRGTDGGKSRRSGKGGKPAETLAERQMREENAGRRGGKGRRGGEGWKRTE